MKQSFLFLVTIILFSISNAGAQTFIDDATKMAKLVPAINATPCKPNTKPCALTNKATDRSITVKVEETFIVDKQLHKKIIVLEKVAPGENRYIGCAGTTKDELHELSTGYKILIAHYDEPVEAEVRAVLSDN